LSQEIDPEEDLKEKPQNFPTEQLLSLLNNVIDKVNLNKNADKNPLEMLTTLKKLRKDI